MFRVVKFVKGYLLGRYSPGSDDDYIFNSYSRWHSGGAGIGRGGLSSYGSVAFFYTIETFPDVAPTKLILDIESYQITREDEALSLLATVYPEHATFRAFVGQAVTRW